MKKIAAIHTLLFLFLYKLDAVWSEGMDKFSKSRGGYFRNKYAGDYIKAFVILILVVLGIVLLYLAFRKKK